MSSDQNTRAGSVRPTLLMVGAGDSMGAALEVALERHGLSVQTVGLAGLEIAVRRIAPDVILLVGDAADDGGLVALTLLEGDTASGAVPVVLLAQDRRVASHMHAFRHGAMAVVPRGASADAVARRVVQLEREFIDHFEAKTGETGEATFAELVDLVKREVRSGILSVHQPGSDRPPTRVVLGAGRPVAEAVQEFVERLRPHVEGDRPVRYQFHTSTGGPVGVLEASTASSEQIALPNLRILVVDEDAGRAQTIARALRQREAIVFVTDTQGTDLGKASGLDPQVAIIDADGLQGEGFEVVRHIRTHMRMRWASMLVASWDELWPDRSEELNLHGLARRIQPLLAGETDLTARAQRGEPFDTRLEAMGPSRMLRVLVGSGATLHVSVRNPRARVEVDVAQGLVVGVVSQMTDGTELHGTAALASLLALGSGRVHIEHRENPAVANVMAPIDEALSFATTERESLRKFVSFAEDEPAHEAATAVRDLEGMARATEAILEPRPARPTPVAPFVSASAPRTPRSRRPTGKQAAAAPPSRGPTAGRASADYRSEAALRRKSPGAKKVTVPPPRPRAPMGGPVAAGEHRLKKSKVARKKTLAVSALVIPPPTEEASSQELTAVMTYAEANLAPSSRPPSRPPQPETLSDAPTLVPPKNQEPAPQTEPIAAEAPPPASPPEPVAKPQPVSSRQREPQSSEEQTLVAARSLPLGLAETVASSDLSDTERQSLSDGVLAQEAAQPIEIGSLPPPEPPGQGAPTAALTPPAPVAPAPVDPRPPSRSTTHTTDESTVPPAAPRPPGVARVFAKAAVAVGALMLLLSVGAVGYRASGLHEPHVDRLIVALGGTPRGTTARGDAPPSDGPDRADSSATGPVAPGSTGGAPTSPAPDAPAPDTPPPDTDEPNHTDTADPRAGEGTDPTTGDATAGDSSAADPDPTDSDVEHSSTAERETHPEPRPAPPASERDEVQDLLREARALRNTDGAETIYRRILELNPREHHAMVGLARLLMSRDEYPEAVALMRGAQSRRPRRVAYLLWLGDALMGTGDAAAAHQQWRRALEIDPDNTQAQWRLNH